MESTLIQMLAENSQTIPVIALASLFLGGLYYMVRSGAKKIGDSNVERAEKRRLMGGAGLLSMITGFSSAGSGIGYLNQPGVEWQSLGGGAIGCGVAGVIVGIILFSTACTWDFRS
jgi:hypothetical protein